MRNLSIILATALMLGACKQSNKVNLNADSTNKANGVDTLKERVVTADRLIEPGKRIGGTALNENVDSVIHRLGKPDRSDAAMGASMSTWFAYHDTTSYETDIYARRNMGGTDGNASRIKIIRITSPQFKTEDRLGVGNTLQQINDHFKTKFAIMYASPKDTISIYDDRGKGIAFEMNKQLKCTGVMIHQLNDSAAAYISMHPHMQRIK